MMAENQAVTKELKELLDSFVSDSGPVALHLRQKMLPVEGEGGVIFPPTYAKIGYVIDELSDGTKVAQMDSVGSQANRMEPLFKERYKDLVPQVDIKLENGRTVSMLDAGHRLGDALVRSTRELSDEARKAFAAFDKEGDAGPMAKLAPTSLVFGAWDSRDSQTKLPRLVNSVIRAWDVDPISRAATYVPPVDYEELGVYDATFKEKKENKEKLAKRGFVHNPADGVGGIVVRGGVYRDVTVNLVALRHLKGENNTKSLQRYILGLALISATDPQDGFLRQGCLITPDFDEPGTWQQINRNGQRIELDLNLEVVEGYAQEAAREFGVGEGGTYDFDKELAKQDVAKKDK